MFRDLCAVTGADTALFIFLCAVLGAVVGIGTAWLLHKRWLEHGLKIGYLTMIPIGLFAGFVAKWLVPDPRDGGQLYGYTPDVIFYPGYAFCLVPIFAVAALLVGLHIRRSRQDRS